MHNQRITHIQGFAECLEAYEESSDLMKNAIRIMAAQVIGLNSSEVAKAASITLLDEWLLPE